MRPRAWSSKRERQYEHIKAGLKPGRYESVSEATAARTAKKDRARSGEAKRSSPTSTRDRSAERRAACGRVGAPEGGPVNR